MDKQQKGFLRGVAATLLCVGLVGSAFAAYQRQATLDYADIKIALNGTIITPKDANGAPVEPFAIDGTTYLPVRAVGNALGLAVDWNGATNTVLLTSGQSQEHNYILLMDLFRTMEEDFDSMESDFDMLVSGNYELLSSYIMASGPYQGLSFFSSVVVGTNDRLLACEKKYNVCSNAGLLTEQDIQLMGEYRRLAGKLKHAYTTLETGAELAKQMVIAGARQDLVDCTTGEMSAGASFVSVAWMATGK